MVCFFLLLCSVSSVTLWFVPLRSTRIGRERSLQERQRFMSRTTLCVITAAALAVLSVGTMAARWCLLGDEVRRPVGPGTWKVTLAVQGTSQGQARVFTATPLDLERQRVIDDVYHSDELLHKPPEARPPERRRVVWSQRPGTPNEAFTARSEFLISLHKTRIVGGSRAGAGLYAPPAQGEHLGDEP